MMCRILAWVRVLWWWLRSSYAFGFRIRIERTCRVSPGTYAAWLAREGDGGPTTIYGKTAAKALNA